jgi:hypothetical protein
MEPGGQQSLGRSGEGARSLGSVALPAATGGSGPLLGMAPVCPGVANAAYISNHSL